MRWRRANCALRCASSSIAASSVHVAVEKRPALAVADGREGRQRRVESLAQGACLLDQAGVELGTCPDVDATPVLDGLDRELDPEHGRPVARAAPGAAHRRGAWRSRGRGRRAAGCAGRCGWRATARALQAGRTARPARHARVHPRARRARTHRTAARRCRCRRTRPAARSRSPRRGSRRLPAPPAPRAPSARAPGTPPPSTPRRARRGRCRDARPAPAPRRSPWPSRCPGRDRPAANPRSRSPTGCRAR